MLNGHLNMIFLKLGTLVRKDHNQLAAVRILANQTTHRLWTLETVQLRGDSLTVPPTTALPVYGIKDTLAAGQRCILCPQSCGRQAGGDPDMMKTDPYSVLRPSSELSCPMSPPSQDRWCVNIDNNRWCPGACMQFFSVSNVQVYSLPPVALRRLRGLRVAHVSSEGMWQGMVEPRHWW